ncbi:MAG: thiamine pyrophosphate-binding protein [Burkholderiaceae bacterium]
MVSTKKKIVESIVDCGAKHAFTLPGLGVTWMLNEFYEARKDLRLILSRSEQHASIMAQAYGKAIGKPAVFMGQGPFATTTGAFGILEAYFAGSPMVVLTDTSCYDGFGMRGVYQTMTGDYGAADARAVLKTMTKACNYATDVDEAVYGIQMAFKQAVLPRMGPAALVLKSNIIRKEFDINPRVSLYPSAGYQSYSAPKPDPDAVAAVGVALKNASKPLFIVGQGCQDTRARDLIARVAKTAGIAVASSYNGKGVIDETSPVSVGMLGTWGTKSGNAFVRSADVIVVIGASLGPDYMRFCEPDFIRPQEQRIIQVDVDPRNSGWVYPVELSIQSDSADFLEALGACDLGNSKREDRLQWITQNNEDHGYGRLPDYSTKQGTVHSAEVVKCLDQHLTSDDLLTLDAGNNRIWVTGAMRIRTPGQLLAPGGIGGMGWSIPAAIGAKAARPDKRLISLTGDGGAGMSVTALSTAIAENLPITVIVSNNGGLGMVRDNMKGIDYGVTYPSTNFAQMARAMGCDAVEVDSVSDLKDALESSRGAEKPFLIDVSVDPSVSHYQVSDY